MIEKKESLAKSEEHLNEQEEKARADLEASDELLNEASSKQIMHCQTFHLTNT